MIDVESNPIETTEIYIAKSLVETIFKKKSGYKVIDTDARREAILYAMLECSLNDDITKALTSPKHWRG